MVEMAAPKMEVVCMGQSAVGGLPTTISVSQSRFFDSALSIPLLHSFVFFRRPQTHGNSSQLGDVGG
jgi:hypothetical protein